MVSYLKGRGRINVYDNGKLFLFACQNGSWLHCVLMRGWHPSSLIPYPAYSTADLLTASQVLWTYRVLEGGGEEVQKLIYPPSQIRVRSLLRLPYLVYLKFSISYVKSLSLIQFTWNFSFTISTNFCQYPRLVEGLTLSACHPCWRRLQTFPDSS